MVIALCFWHWRSMFVFKRRSNVATKVFKPDACLPRIPGTVSRSPGKPQPPIGKLPPPSCAILLVYLIVVLQVVFNYCQIVGTLHQHDEFIHRSTFNLPYKFFGFRCSYLRTAFGPHHFISISLDQTHVMST